MSIHFDFVVSDIDAQNIMSILNDEIGRIGMQIIDDMANNDLTPAVEANISWYKSHQVYLKELMLKMKNTRVETKKLSLAHIEGSAGWFDGGTC